ncbi:hypothetical protein BG000_006740, partial [Podila horticola]
MTVEALATTKVKLFLSNANILRVTKKPSNIRLEIHTQPKDARLGLRCLLGTDKTIVYFEKISILIDTFRYVFHKRSDLQGCMGVYYSTLSPAFKKEIMEMFVESKIHILFATEAAGMGCDIPDVVQVIQYG